MLTACLREHGFTMHIPYVFTVLQGTMTAAPWETIGLYLVYVFQKRDPALMC